MSTPPRTLTTAAGRALEQRLAYDRDPAYYEPGDFFIDDRRAILAIEAEARAPLDVERLARAVSLVMSDLDWTPAPIDVVQNSYWQDRAAAIAREYATQEPQP